MRRSLPLAGLVRLVEPSTSTATIERCTGPPLTGGTTASWLIGPPPGQIVHQVPFLSMTRQADDYPLVSKPGLPWTALPGPRPPRVRPCVGPHSGGRPCMARARAPSRGHVLRLCTAFDKLGRL